MMGSVEHGPGLRARLLGGGLWAVAGKVIGLLAIVAINASLARLMSAEDVGRYFLIVSMVSVAVLVSQLGLQQALVRFVAEANAAADAARAHAYVVSALSLGAVASVVIALLVYAGKQYIVGVFFEMDHVVPLFVLTGAWIVVRAVLGLLAESYRGYHNVKAATFYGTVTNNIVLVIALAAFVASGSQADLERIIQISVLSHAVCLAYAFTVWKVQAAGVGRAAVSAREMIGTGMPIMLVSVTTFFFTQADLWIVGAFLPEDKTAVYGVAVRMAQIAAAPLALINGVVASTIAELYVSGQHQRLQKLLRMFTSVATVGVGVVLVGYWVGGEAMLSTLYGSYYKAGFMPLVLLTVGQFVNTFFGSSAILLLMIGRQVSLLVICVLCGLLFLLVAMKVVDAYGINAAAAIAASVMALQAAIVWYWAGRTTGIWCEARLGAVADGVASFLSARRVSTG